MSKLTPMMAQYRKIKASVPDAILLFRLGDFYEMFGEDARQASPVLEIALTARNTTPMCGIPYHAAGGYIEKLLKAGFKAAICEQVGEPGEGKGIVEREVVRVVTPGTAVEETLLNSRKNNYLAAVHHLGNVFGFAYVDLLTGEFKVAELTTLEELRDELLRVEPSECLLTEPLLRQLESGSLPGLDPIRFTELDQWMFDYEMAYDALKKQFGTASLDGFGCQKLVPGIGAAGALVQYAGDTLRAPLDHIDSLSVFSPREFMVMDAVSQRNLEIIEPIRGGERAGTLLGVLDRTMNSMGGRTLRRWLLQPMVEPESINRRLDAVEELTRSRPLLATLRDSLKEVRDIQRIVGRVSYGSTNARELAALRESLKMAPGLAENLRRLEAGVWGELAGDLEAPPSLTDLLEKALVDNPPPAVKEGGMIREGYNQELDELHRLTREGKDWLVRYQKRESERTGIKSLKVRHNKVFGYYIEVTRSNLDSVPEDYIRKQTLVGAERFITEELKNYEGKVLGAQERARALEYELFEEVRKEVGKVSSRLRSCASALGVVDALAALADTAVRNRYVRPRVDSSSCLEIKNGRHPVVERILVDERFVGNDTLMDGEENQIFVITGPNMAGKSTYIRQVALIVLMAQVGSFVPADAARIGTADRIFTRVGASDELTRGQSTFMVEMTETANILHHATSRSLVILDEIGRGTSTFDGISIAWAVAEYLQGNPSGKARTLFATHYHELTELESILPGVKNYNVAVKEWNDRVIFLRKVVRGGTDKSYGIQVARLAGLPKAVVERAKVILAGLESGAISEEGLPRFARTPGGKEADGNRQLYLFPTGDHPLIREIKNINLDHITPFEAMQRLKELVERAGEEE